MKPHLRRPAAVVLLSGAFAVSAWLLVRSLALAAGTAGAGDACSALFVRGCDETLRGPFSTVGGIPLAGWGAIHFAILLGLLALGRILGDAVRDAAASAAALLAAAGALGSAVLIATIAAGLVPPCPLCLVANGLNLAALAPVLRWSGRPVREVVRDWGRAAAYLGGKEAGRPEAVPLRNMALACAALAAVVLYQWVLIEWDRAKLRGREVDPERVLASFTGAPVVEIPVDPSDPALGPAAAKSTLVVFSDAFCPSCRGFWNVLPVLAGPYGGDLRIVFKHFPLDPPCNASAREQVHPYACRAAVALEAALRQGKFWPYQAALEAPAPGRKEDAFGRAAEAAGLDVDRFRADMADPAIKDRLERDVALGRRLGVDATPTMFLDGRRIAAPSPKAIEILLAHVLGRREAGARPAPAVPGPR